MVSRRIPQGSVLCLLIKDLELKVCREVDKFVNDTKLFRAVRLHGAPEGSVEAEQMGVITANVAQAGDKILSYTLMRTKLAIND